MKRAIIVGCQGQDGRLLAELLSQNGYRLKGVAHNSSIDIRDFKQVRSLVSRFKPDEIYHLAAFHHSSQDGSLEPVELLRRSWEVNVLSLANFLEAVRQRCPRARLFYAASSHIFGAVKSGRADEKTPLAPLNVYGVTKAAGLLLCRLYRAQHALFVSVGILFNHESPLRQPQFVSRKIIRGALAIKKGLARTLVLGNLDAEVDWGYAPDYVEAMVAILQHSSAGDFVIASGKKKSVRQFAASVFARLGLDWKRHVRSNPALLSRDSKGIVGNSARLTSATGWRPRMAFDQMIGALIRAEEDSWQGR